MYSSLNRYKTVSIYNIHTKNKWYIQNYTNKSFIRVFTQSILYHNSTDLQWEKLFLINKKNQIVGVKFKRFLSFCTLTFEILYHYHSTLCSGKLCSRGRITLTFIHIDGCSSYKKLYYVLVIVHQSQMVSVSFLYLRLCLCLCLHVHSMFVGYR